MGLMMTMYQYVVQRINNLIRNLSRCMHVQQVYVYPPENQIPFSICQKKLHTLNLRHTYTTL